VAKKVVLAYSGGLDTSVAVKWMAEEWGVDVVALAADVGQGGDFEAIRARALGAGAVAAEVVDARDEFAREYVTPALRANAKYEGKYPLVSALSRPLIARHLVEAARAHGADAVAHGCTGKGNDQVRFEVSVRALAPELDVLAPVRVWGFTREDSIEYAAKHDIPVDATKRSPYSVDENLWGRTVECGILEDPWVEPPDDIYDLTAPPAGGVPEPREVVLGFEGGVPVSLDGKTVALHELVPELSAIVGAYEWGRIDMVENRRVGIKSREIYEPRYAELVYDGLWFSPLREAMDAFVASSQEVVTGEVRLRLEPGVCAAVGRRAERGLYDYELATYDAADAFRHEDAAGFVRLWGLSLETWGRRHPPER
jgi:argininosuccinate synthase